MKVTPPTIYVVLEETYDYGLSSCDPVACFFNEQEADDWAEEQNKSDHRGYRVEKVPPNNY